MKICEKNNTAKDTITYAVHYNYRHKNKASEMIYGVAAQFVTLNRCVKSFSATREIKRSIIASDFFEPTDTDIDVVILGTIKLD